MEHGSRTLASSFVETQGWRGGTPLSSLILTPELNLGTLGLMNAWAPLLFPRLPAKAGRGRGHGPGLPGCQIPASFCACHANLTRSVGLSVWKRTVQAFKPTERDSNTLLSSEESILTSSVQGRGAQAAKRTHLQVTVSPSGWRESQAVTRDLSD